MQIWKTIPFTMGLLVLQAQGTPFGNPSPNSVPLYRVMVVQGSAKAINYRNLGSSTKVDLKGTVLMPGASGVATVKGKDDGIHITAKVKDLPPASTFGDPFLTYVLWGISTEGKATNLGEIIIKGGRGKLDAIEPRQTFGLVVTAEPYFAVSQPSDVVVMENMIRKNTEGQVELIDAKYELLKRGQYTLNLNPSEALVMDKDTPFTVYQARNAVRIAQASGASVFAQEPFGKAQDYLSKAESSKGGMDTRVMMAREAVQRAEEARLISVERQAAELAALEQQMRQTELDQANRTAAMASDAQAVALRQTEVTELENAELRSTNAGLESNNSGLESSNAELKSSVAGLESTNAGLESSNAELESSNAGLESSNAGLASSNAGLASSNAGLESSNAGLASSNAGLESRNADLRNELKMQLDAVLETRATTQGLIVNMSGVLFPNGKAALLPEAREKLAKIAGILASHPGLKIEASGFTDSMGSEAANLRLSEQRASNTREYLISQGVPADSITSEGFGEDSPIASNATNAGRQKNRRVELVVTGEGITDPVDAGL